MIRWIPLVVRPGPVIEARDRIAAIEQALALHGADLVRVQSEVSYLISEDETRAAQEQRRQGPGRQEDEG